ncbi:MAG: dihydroorotase [Saprospiraceae bacterium]
MLLLLKNIRIAEGKSGSKTRDLLLRDGIIEQIAEDIPARKNMEVWQWDSDKIHASPGWMDIGAQTGDPGYEHREDLNSAASAAAAGGYTSVACFPNTHPAIASKSEVLYVKNKTAHSPVTFYPVGAISEHCEGKDLAELYDMHAAGAIAFSDGSKPVQDAGLLLRALQYARAFGGLVINEPQQRSIAAGGQMHEGLVSTSLGLKGIPALAEEIVVQRDLRLLEYAEGRLHIHLLSTAAGVALVREAKKAGLPVTASVAVANLCFTDEKLRDFDSNWKILPPLRSRADADALLEGLHDGTIDLIASNHVPWHEEAKNLEFPFAEFGMSGLQTTFALCRTFLGEHLKTAEVIEKIALAPRRILGLPVPEIKVGARAELTIFDPDATWTFEERDIRSKSRNTPFTGQQFKGKVLGIVNNGQALRFA